MDVPYYIFICIEGDLDNTQKGNIYKIIINIIIIILKEIMIYNECQSGLSLYYLYKTNYLFI